MKFRTLTAAITAAAFALQAVPAVAQDAEVFDENAELPEANVDVEAQMNGQFPPMLRPDAVPLGAVQEQWTNAGADAGILRVEWDPYKSIKLKLREAMTTTIRLPEWEQIDRVVLGNTRVFKAEQLNENTVEVWATHPGADTSLKILGASQNIYVFYLRGETWNSKNIPDLTVMIEAPVPGAIGGDAPSSSPQQIGPVSIMKPRQQSEPMPSVWLSSAGGETKKPEWLKDVSFDPSRIRRDLALFGDAELAPDDVFRDDQFTYLCYGERWDDSDLMVAAPAIVTDRVDRQVNFRVKSGCLIIEAIGTVSLKHGNSVLCVKPDPDLAQPRQSAAAARVRALQSAPATKAPADANSQPADSSSPPAGAAQQSVEPLPAADASAAMPATTPTRRKGNNK